MNGIKTIRMNEMTQELEQNRFEDPSKLKKSGDEEEPAMGNEKKWPVK